MPDTIFDMLSILFLPLEIPGPGLSLIPLTESQPARGMAPLIAGTSNSMLILIAGAALITLIIFVAALWRRRTNKSNN